MFTETSLRKIKDFSANDPVVSLYLNTEPSRGNAETHRLRLRNMLKDIPLTPDVFCRLPICSGSAVQRRWRILPGFCYMPLLAE